MPPPPKAVDHSDSLQGVPDLGDLDVASEEMPVAKPAPLLKKKLKVVANRAGFIFQERKVAGDKFEVHEHELGSWMDCEDPVEHKKHVKRLQDKKKKINSQAVKDHENELADE